MLFRVFASVVLFDDREYISAALYEYKSAFLCLLVFALHSVSITFPYSWFSVHFPAQDRSGRSDYKRCGLACCANYNLVELAVTGHDAGTTADAQK